ncbi:hypothetical protein IFM89_017522 [Coptis chinensis]|uniref:Uncharacterized protein n=1 Tax=Coptis chinensis TaxID=261450 RepID=A0A835HY72_9MAGN|nr:hypothetical protein IFM89_017522 [Coptis chinensis]
MAMDAKKARVAEILASDQKRTSALLGIKEFESKWIGWAGVNAPDEIGQRALSNAHLKGVYFLCPTSENIQHLRRQIASPRFGKYHFFFSNIMKDTQIHVLANVDEHEVVKQEFYADFSAIDLHHFSLKFPPNHIYMLSVVVDHSSLKNFSDRVIDDKQTGDLYGNRDLLNIARNMTRGIKEVKNVYTQHQPLLFKTMGRIVKGRLRDVDYPFV